MKQKLKFLNVILLTFLFVVSCEVNEDVNNINHLEKINPANIEDAKSLFNLNYGQSNNGSGTLQKSTNTIQVDWQSSKTKEYKETSTQDVDILYTPIYINTNANAKAFIATVDNNGITESKLFVVLYKENPFGNTGLSAYVFRYAIDGTIEIGYNLENGVQIPFYTSTTTSSLNKSNSNCDEYPSSGDFDEVQVWLEDCGGILEDVVVEAPPTPTETIDAGPSSGGGCLDCSSWPAFDSSIFNDNSTSSGTSSNVNPSVIVPNMVSADPISIAIALEAPPLSQEYTWLNNLPTNEQTQELFEAIAQFLNDNKAKSPDPAFVNTNPNQFPDIKDSAIDTVIDLILLLIENQNSNTFINLVIEILNDDYKDPTHEENCANLSDLGQNFEFKQSLESLHWSALDDSFHIEVGYEYSFDNGAVLLDNNGNYGIPLVHGGTIYGVSHTHPYEDTAGMRHFPMFSVKDLYAFGFMVTQFSNPGYPVDYSNFFLILTAKTGTSSTSTYALKINDWIAFVNFVYKFYHLSDDKKSRLQRDLIERYQKSSENLNGASQSDYFKDLFEFMEDEDIKGLDVYEATDQNYTNWRKVNYDNNSDTLLPSTNCNN